LCGSRKRARSSGLGQQERLDGFLNEHRGLIEEQVKSHWSVNEIRHWLKDGDILNGWFDGLEITTMAKQISRGLKEQQSNLSLATNNKTTNTSALHDNEATSRRTAYQHPAPDADENGITPYAAARDDEATSHRNAYQYPTPGEDENVPYYTTARDTELVDTRLVDGHILGDEALDDTLWE
jgi:hypothetical protein